MYDTIDKSGQLRLRLLPAACCPHARPRRLATCLRLGTGVAAAARQDRYVAKLPPHSSLNR